MTGFPPDLWFPASLQPDFHQKQGNPDRLCRVNELRFTHFLMALSRIFVRLFLQMSSSEHSNSSSPAVHGNPSELSGNDLSPSTDFAPEAHFQWFCIRAQYHKELLAEFSLQREGVETFLPKIRYPKKSTWIEEPLFPGYLFAKFQPSRSLRLLRYCQGVSTVVHFGLYTPVISEETIHHLKELIGPEGTKELPYPVRAGDEVEVLSGPFLGFEAIVTRVIPARKRVAVLIDFLGRQSEAELELGSLRLKTSPTVGLRRFMTIE